MAELVDARDLKSREHYSSCRFESDLRHYFIIWFCRFALLSIKKWGGLNNYFKSIINSLPKTLDIFSRVAIVGLNLLIFSHL